MIREVAAERDGDGLTARRRDCAPGRGGCQRAGQVAVLQSRKPAVGVKERKKVGNMEEKKEGKKKGKKHGKKASRKGGKKDR